MDKTRFSKKQIVIYVSIILGIALCIYATKLFSQGVIDFRTKQFIGSPNYELAKAVWKEDTKKIEEIIHEDRSLLNYVDNEKSVVLLDWAVYFRKYKAVEKLLQLGANPDLEDKNGHFALGRAAEIPETTKYIELLLKYGAKVNQMHFTIDSSNGSGKTALRCAVKASIMPNIKKLVESGADINQVNKFGFSLLGIAFVTENPDIIKYLVVDCNADIKLPVFIKNNGDSLYILSSMRDLEYPIGSRQYKIKMEIVNYLKKKGLDYWKEPIPLYVAQKHNKGYLDNY